MIVCDIQATYQFYSQNGQDKFIYEHFFKKKKTIGRFVEIGAFDGITFSNSAFFEKNLGWHGICIEPVPEFFNELIKNRNCFCINGCISNQSGTKLFMVVGMLSGLLDKYDERHLARIDTEVSLYNLEKRLIQVNCYRFNDIMKRYGVKHIDYLSIDTEGGELEILKSINFNAITIDIISVENNYNDKNFEKFLDTQGYRLVQHIGVDEIYQRIGFVPYV